MGRTPRHLSLGRHILWRVMGSRAVASVRTTPPAGWAASHHASRFSCAGALDLSDPWATCDWCHGEWGPGVSDTLLSLLRNVPTVGLLDPWGLCRLTILFPPRLLRGQGCAMARWPGCILPFQGVLAAGFEDRGRGCRAIHGAWAAGGGRGRLPPGATGSHSPATPGFHSQQPALQGCEGKMHAVCGGHLLSCSRANTDRHKSGPRLSPTALFQVALCHFSGRPRASRHFLGWSH